MSVAKDLKAEQIEAIKKSVQDDYLMLTFTPGPIVDAMLTLLI